MKPVYTSFYYKKASNKTVKLFEDRDSEAQVEEFDDGYKSVMKSSSPE